jgi:hypothetical protein
VTTSVLPTPVGTAERDDDPVRVFGIRHHGPGSARSLLRALDEYGPDAVLIEGPADADQLIGWVTAEEMQPPLALLAYAADEPKVSAFWPFAVFSPEWQAMVWAVQRGVEVRFCDLPAAQVLAPQNGGATLFDETEHRGPRRDDPARDPLGTLAAAAGYDDPERWWEDLVESRLDSSSPFPLLVEAMAELRSASGPPSPSERRREAYMRQTIRAARRRGRDRVAVVCGAWHAPVLTWPLPPANADSAVLRGSAKRKVTLTWVPWTAERLASASGYGAGITSPGWYHHLWTAPEGTIPRWLVKVARALRERDLPASSAHVIEAVRLAETLASLRSRPLAGLTEVTEATRAVLCDGDERAVRYVTEHLVVGQALGSVNERVPTVPLDADLVRTCRSLRVRREPDLRHWDLDLRRTIDRNRSQLFHRLRLLELDWVRPAESDIASQGTFREVWASRWRPEFAVQLVEASVWGTTVESAATARIDQIRRDGTLPELTRTVGRCLLAALPAALEVLLVTVAERAARDVDVVHLMEAMPPLARAQRYGDVRQTDTAALSRVIETLLVRTCAGLSRAVSGLDADNAAAMRRRIDELHGALGLLQMHPDPGEGSTRSGHIPLRERWLAALAQLADRSDLHGLLQGRIVRLLTDAEILDDAAHRLGRALSAGVDAADKAAWVEGFFADGALLLIHDPGLRDLLDEWVGGLSEAEFTDLLPLVRRTFGTFSAAERRTIAGRLSSTEAAAVEEDLDPARVARALATVDLILRPIDRQGDP